MTMGDRITPTRPRRSEVPENDDGTDGPGPVARPAVTLPAQPDPRPVVDPVDVSTP